MDLGMLLQWPWWWGTSCMNFSVWIQPLPITLSFARPLTQVRLPGLVGHDPPPKWLDKFCTKTYMIWVMDHSCAPSPVLVFQYIPGTYRLQVALMHPCIFNPCFASSSCHVVAHIGMKESAWHLGTSPTRSWGLSRWVDLSLTWNPSLDYKWLKSLHHNILAACNTFLKNFTGRFGRKGAFLKIRQVWGSDLIREISRLKPLVSSICSEKLCAEQGAQHRCLPGWRTPVPSTHQHR